MFPYVSNKHPLNTEVKRRKKEHEAPVVEDEAENDASDNGVDGSGRACRHVRSRRLRRQVHLPLSRLLPQAPSVFSFYVSLFHRRWLSPRAQTLSVCDPLSLVAFDSTLPSLHACASSVRILLVPLRTDPPTRKLSAPAPHPRT